jgi:hypothetical protein
LSPSVCPSLLIQLSPFFLPVPNILRRKGERHYGAVCSRLGCAVYCVITDPSQKIKWDFRMIAFTQCSLLPKRNEHFSWLLRQSCTRSSGQTVMRRWSIGLRFLIKKDESRVSRTRQRRALGLA